MSLFKIIGEFVSEGANKLLADIETINKSAKNLDTNLGAVSTSITKVTNDFSRSMTAIGGYIDTARGSVDKLKREIQYVSAASMAIAKFSFDAAASKEDTLEFFEDNFGEMAERGNKWAADLAKAYRVNETNLKASAVSIRALVSSMGMTDEDAFDIATNLTQLSYSISTALNKDLAQVQNAIKSALMGNASALGMMGIEVKKSTVVQKALELGIAKTGEELNEQQRILATYALILERTGQYANNYADNIDGATQKKMQFKDQVQTLQEELGEKMLPIITEFMDKLGELIDWFTDLDDRTKDLIARFILFLAVLLPILTGVSMGLGLVSNLTKVIAGLGDVIGWVAANPGTALVAMLITANAALWGYILTNKEFQAAFVAAWKGLKLTVAEFVYSSVELLDKFFNFLGLKSASEATGKLLKGLNETVGKAAREFYEAADTHAAIKEERIFQEKLKTSLSEEAYKQYQEEQKRLKSGFKFEESTADINDYLNGINSKIKFDDRYTQALDRQNETKRERNRLDKEALDLAKKLERAALIEIERDLSVGRFARETGRQFRMSATTTNILQNNNSRIESLLERLISVTEDKEVNVNIRDINSGVEGSISKNISIERRRTPSRTKLGGIV